MYISVAEKIYKKCKKSLTCQTDSIILLPPREKNMRRGKRMGKGNELDNIVESILELLLLFIKGMCRGIWRGLHKLNTLKRIALFMLTFIVPVVVWICWPILGEKMTEVYYVLLGFPVLVLWMAGQMDGKDNYEEMFRQIAFKGRDGSYPQFLSKNPDGKKIILIFKSTIPLTEWKAARERLETALDCNIIKMENGRNKKQVRLTTLPSDFKIPEMIEWNEEYLKHKNGVLTVGISALEQVVFDLNRVPHVLVAGETGSGKSVILRCLLWQMILQGARVYMIDFKGGVEFGKQYEKYGEVITDRQRALEVLNLLVTENEYRLRIFRDLEVKNLNEYNKKTKQNLCRIGVFTDELAEMLDKKGVAKEEKAIYEQIEGKLSTLARLSRATGINLFMGVQRPDANVLTGQIKNNIPVRISGRFADKTASEIVLGNTDAVNLPDIKGRFLYKVGNETIEFQSFYFDDERMLREVDVEEGDMLTEAPIYHFKPPEEKEERKRSKVQAVGKKCKPVGKRNSEYQKEEQTEPNMFEGMSQQELEREMLKMDEEDLNLNFDEWS